MQAKPVAAKNERENGEENVNEEEKKKGEEDKLDLFKTIFADTSSEESEEVRVTP